MKNFKVLLMSILILGCLNSKASNDPNLENLIVSIKSNNSENTFTLQMANLQQFDTNIYLYNDQGHVLHHKQIIYSSELQLKYVLKDFPDGYYSLEIDWNQKRKVWNIYKDGSELEFLMKREPTKEGIWLVQN